MQPRGSGSRAAAGRARLPARFGAAGGGGLTVRADVAAGMGDRGHPGWQLAVAALLVGSFMAVLDTSIVTVALPAMETTFGIDTEQVQWVVTAYLMALGVAAPVSGWLADWAGYRRLYLWSTGVFACGSLAAAVAPDLAALVSARVIQAAGAGMILPATTGLIFRLVPRRRLGTVNGFRGLALLVAPVLGPLLGGYLVEYANWRWIFTLNLPVGAFGLLLGAAVIPELRERHRTPFDRWGFVTAATGLGTLLLALSEGRTLGWTSLAVIGLLETCALSLGAFVWIELVTEHPMIDLGVLRLTSYRASVLYVMILDVVTYAGLFFIPIFLQTVRGGGAVQSGFVLLGAAAAAAVVMPLAGLLYDHVDAKVPVVAGTCLMALGGWLLRRIGVFTPAATIAGWLVVWGLGMGLALMPALTAGLSVVPDLLLGRATALRNVAQRVASAVGLATLTSLLETETARRATALRSALAQGSTSGTRLQLLLHRYADQPQVRGLLLQAIHTRLEQTAFARSLGSVFAALALLGLLGLLPALRLRGARGQDTDAVETPRPG